MPATPPPDPAAGRPDPTAPRPGSSLVRLQPAKPANTDDSPTVITGPKSGPPSDPSLGLSAGGRLGHFELIEAVGAGGMAAVLKARDLDLNRLVALKILPPHMARDPENVARFKLEARAAAKLDHEHIARVFFCGEDQNLHFIAFEFIEGDNLRTLIDRKGTLPPAEAVRYMIQVAAGLAHAADRGVVHRDVKPSNVVVTPDGRAKLVDMGLARALGGQSVNGGVTQSGVTLGTFDYISPEQALDPRQADVRSDLYSLGCAFYHALTGRPPVPDGTAAKKLHAHQHEPVLDPRVLNPKVPDDLAAVLATLMAKDPARRYQTPAALIADLMRVAAGLNLAADALPSDVGSVARTAAPPRPAVLPAVWVSVAVAAVVIGFAVLPGRDKSSAVPWLDDPPPAATKSPPPEPTVPPTPPAPNPDAATAEDVARLLQSPVDGDVTVDLRPNTRYDLTRLTNVGFTGRKLVIRGRPGAAAPTVRVAATPPGPAADRPGSLTVVAETVEISGVRFELADGPDGDDAPLDPAGVLVDAGRVTLAECRFDADPMMTALGAAAVAVDRGVRPAEVSVRHALFTVRRGVGLRLTGRVKAAVTESAFATQQYAVQLVAALDVAPTDPNGDLTLSRCSVLLEDKAAAVDATAAGRWQVSAGHCVFAAPPPDPASVAMATMMEHADRKASVLRGADGPDVRLTGRPAEPNAYFRADPFADPRRAYSFDELRAQVAPPVVDPQAVVLSQSPWAADPLAGLATDRPWEAFQLRADLRPVRVPAPVVMLGARQLPTANDKIYPAWPPAVPQEAATSEKTKVWWPAAPAAERDRLPKNVFTDLGLAVAALRPGDDLLVRHTGEVAVPPTALPNTAKARVTIRPDAGSAPVLIPADPTGGPLFTVPAGELTLDKLEFRLSAAAAVGIGGGKRVVLRNCVLTLDERDRSSPVAGVVVGDGGEPVEVRIADSLVRGRGRAVWVTAGRRYAVEFSDTATVLAGPVLACDATTRPAAVPRVRLERVTALLGGPLLDLKPPAGDGPAVAVDAEKVLFVPVGGRVPVVAVAGDPDRWDKYLTVTGRDNWYAGFGGGPFAVVTSADGAMAARRVSAADWFAFVREPAAGATAAVALSNMPTAPGQMREVMPDDLEVLTPADEQPAAAGCAADKLPTPAGGRR